MKKLALPLLFSAILSGGVYSGTATITGSASVSKPAQFVTVTLTVQSECYKKPSEAMGANNEAAANVQKLLKDFLSNERDAAMHTNGGVSMPFSRTYYSNQTGRSEVVCPNTFQQTTMITFKTFKVDEFGPMYASIQEGVHKNYQASHGSDGNPTQVTYVAIDKPNADVCDETKKAMSRQAATLAAKDAKEQFNAYAAEYNIRGHVEVMNIDNTFSANASRSENSYKSAAASLSGSHTPVVETNFKEITVSDRVKVTYSFPQTLFMCHGSTCTPSQMTITNTTTMSDQ